MPTKKKKPTPKKTEADSAYLLKIVLYVVLGSLWLKFAEPIFVGGFVINALPVGLALGIIFASHDHFQVDRKIEYAILILMTVISYFLPAGIII
jgi:hypothetical protein